MARVIVARLWPERSAAALGVSLGMVHREQV
jgi:hypothetical protein